MAELQSLPQDQLDGRLRSIASKPGAEKKIKELIAAGANPNAPDEKGNTATDIAGKNLDNLKLTQSMGGEITTQTFISAAQSGDIMAINYVAEKGNIDYYYKDKLGQNIAHRTAYGSADADIYKRLKELGVDVTEQNNNGDTPAHIVASEYAYENSMPIYTADIEDEGTLINILEVIAPQGNLQSVVNNDGFTVADTLVKSAIGLLTVDTKNIFKHFNVSHVEQENKETIDSLIDVFFPESAGPPVISSEDSTELENDNIGLAPDELKKRLEILKETSGLGVHFNPTPPNTGWIIVRLPENTENGEEVHNAFRNKIDAVAGIRDENNKIQSIEINAKYVSQMPLEDVRGLGLFVAEIMGKTSFTHSVDNGADTHTKGTSLYPPLPSIGYINEGKGPLLTEVIKEPDPEVSPLMRTLTSLVSTPAIITAIFDGHRSNTVDSSNVTIVTVQPETASTTDLSADNPQHSTGLSTPSAK